MIGGVSSPAARASSRDQRPYAELIIFFVPKKHTASVIVLVGTGAETSVTYGELT